MLHEVLVQNGLSKSEVRVAELIVKGISNKDAASQLFITEKTVKFHLTNIYKKLSVKSRAQLIVWAMPHASITETSEKPATTTTSAALAAPTTTATQSLPTGI